MDQLGLLELIREALIAVVHEMRANVIRSSYSSVIYEGHDFSCALLTADGRHVAQSDGDTPIHIIAVPYSARVVIEAFRDDIHEGDVFLHNDPYTGGTHLNDILMLHPVFSGGRLVLFAAIRYHWADVGGMTAGSLSGQATEIYQEGMRIAPTRICEKGAMNETFLRLLVENMRLPAERMGDFNAMHGTGRKAEAHVRRLLERFGPDDLLTAIEEILRRSEDVMRRRIRELEDGDYHAEGYIESDGVSPESLVGRLKLTIRGDEMTADFSGASTQAAGPTNVGPSMALTLARRHHEGVSRPPYADQSRLVRAGHHHRAGRDHRECPAPGALRRHGRGEGPHGHPGGHGPRPGRSRDEGRRSQGRREPRLHDGPVSRPGGYLHPLRMAVRRNRRLGRRRRQQLHAPVQRGRLQFDSRHRGGGEPIPPARRAFGAARRFLRRWQVPWRARAAAGTFAC